MKLTESKYYSDVYLEWLERKVLTVENYHKKLFKKLFETEFIWLLTNDDNRNSDGLQLRYEWIESIEENEINQKVIYKILEEQVSKNASVLEVIIALAYRFELEWMYDPKYGDRTSQWFWLMLSNLGVSKQNDNNYDQEYCSECIERFIYRKYAYDGRGGLFVLKKPKHDMRKHEIWSQMLYYCNERGGKYE